MLQHALEPNVPLEMEVGYCDVVFDGEQQEQFLRLKGRVQGEYGVLRLDYIAGIDALRAGEVIPGEPKAPDGFGSSIDFYPIKLLAHHLRITRQVSAGVDVLAEGSVASEPTEFLTIAQRMVRPKAQRDIYLECTVFVLETVLPLYRAAGIPVGDVAVGAMVHTNFINRMDRMGGRREY